LAEGSGGVGSAGKPEAVYRGSCSAGIQMGFQHRRTSCA